MSQFTLLADLSRGRRPGFGPAAPPEVAEPMVDRFVARLREGGRTVATGRFGAEMEVELVNDGPFTLLLDAGAEELSQTFSAVRMQREQALMRTGEPLR